MNSYPDLHSGMTLIEAIIYLALFAALMSSTISYVYAMQMRTAALRDAILTEYAR